MNYNSIFGRILLFTVAVTVLSSCQKWLDIKPQTEVESDVVFEKESGFQDALTGVYLKMGQSSLYGKELTFGFVDGLAGQFNKLGQSNEYFATLNYNYTAETFISKSENLFETAYNAIANLNNLIVNINEKGNNGFSGVNYHIIRGEAHGLRALLHFDMIRLYGPSMRTTGATEPAIPYVDTIGTFPRPHLTTEAILDHVLADLEIAAAELAQSDPIIPANAGHASTYLRNRFYKFNYFATKALQARVWLYKGDRTKAAEAALAVIESGVFDWTPSSQIATSQEEQRNKLFTQEHIFALNINTMNTTAASYFDVSSATGLLAKDAAEQQALFSPADYRFVYLFKSTPDNLRLSSSKLVAPTASGSRMPLIRKSEMYYIAAEALAGTDLAAAIGYLNEVRSHRNLPDLSPDTGAENLLTEIELEYRREFIGEGQLFFFYKRNNASHIPDVLTEMTNGIYVLPLPEREIIYGD